MRSWIFLGSLQKTAVCSWWQTVQLVLTPVVVVVMDKLFNCSNQRFVGFKPVEIIHLAFQNVPEAFHWAVINAVTNSGHTLLHPLFVQFLLEGFACILESTITVEQRMCIRILLNYKIKGFKHKLVVIALTNGKRNNISAFQIQNGTEIGTLTFRTVFHLGNISTPLLIYSVCGKLPV